MTIPPVKMRLSAYKPLGIHDQLAFKSLITLDTAVAIEANPFSDSNFQFDVSADPSASGHNFVKAFVRQRTSVQYGFRIPGLPIPVDIDYLFAFRAESEIALNAVTCSTEGPVRLAGDLATIRRLQIDPRFHRGT